jgi:outer membrane protein assembly factor BamB
VDNDRLLLSLRRIAEPVEPSADFLDDLYETLAAELGFRGRTSSGWVPEMRLPARARPRRVRRSAWLAAAALLALAIVGGAALIGALLDRRSTPIPPPFRDVTSYRTNPERSGVQPGPRPSGDPVLIWSTKADGPIQFNPVLASGVLFVGSDDGHLYALDARTGALRWSFDAGIAIKGSAVAVDGVVAVADTNGILHVIDQATGSERWRAEGISDVGNVSAGILYAPGRDTTVHGYDLQTGASRWSWVAPGPVLYVTIVADTAFVTAGGTLHSVAIADGSERWHFETLGGQASLASVAGDQVFVSTRDGTGALTALDRATGSPIWTFPGPRGAIVSLGSIQDGVIYAPTAGAGFFALRAQTGEIVWHIAGSGSILRSTPIVDGVVFAPVDDPGGILALRASDGSIVWRQALRWPMQGWPVVSGGLIFTTDGSGAIHAYGDMVVAPPGGPVTTATSSEGAPSEPVSEPSVPPNPATAISTLLSAATGLSGAVDMDIGPDGNLYVVDDRPMVSVISPEGELLRSWGRAGAGDGQFDFAAPNLGGAAKIAVGRDGLVYVSDGGNRRIQVFTPAGDYLRQVGNRGAEGDRLLVAWDLGVDDGGNVYVIDGGLAALTKFDSDGAFQWRVGGVGSSDPELKSLGHGVKFDPAGHLWIANDDGGRLIAIDADSHEVDAFGEIGSRPGQFAGPCGLNLDRSGNLYVYNCDGGRIQVFDPQHRLIGSWDGPVDDRRQAFAFAPDGLMYQLGPDDTITVIQIELP